MSSFDNIEMMFRALFADRDEPVSPAVAARAEAALARFKKHEDYDRLNDLLESLAVNNDDDSWTAVWSLVQVLVETPA